MFIISKQSEEITDLRKDLFLLNLNKEQKKQDSPKSSSQPWIDELLNALLGEAK